MPRSKGESRLNYHKVPLTVRSPYLDTMSVRVVNDHAIQIVTKKDGKVSGTAKISAPGDGNTLTTEYTFVTESGQQGSGKEETDKRNGKVISVTRMTVAPNGKTMTLNVENKLENATVKLTAEKQ